jgi:hypothetical protein
MQITSSHVDSCEEMKEGNCLCWDSYFEFSTFQMLNIDFFWSRLFLESCIFLHNIKFRHSLSFFKMLSCMYNCNFGPEDKTNNLLALTEDMVFRKGKSKTRVTIKSNGGF